MVGRLPNALCLRAAVLCYVLGREWPATRNATSWIGREGAKSAHWPMGGRGIMPALIVADVSGEEGPSGNDEAIAIAIGEGILCSTRNRPRRPGVAQDLGQTDGRRILFAATLRPARACDCCNEGRERCESPSVKTPRK